MMDPVIEIEEKAAAFIKQQGGVVTVRLSPRHGCCGGTSRIAIAETSTPKDISTFACHQSEEVTLWIAPELAQQGLRLRVEGWWKLKRLFVDGAALASGHADTQQH
ncbi:CC/Se motif family (seleno)protein [Halomonas sp. LY9]